MSQPLLRKKSFHAAIAGLTLLLSACGGSQTPQNPGAQNPANPGSQAPQAPDTLLPEVSLNPLLCGHLQDMNVVAHPDDDLLFMNPDLRNSIRNGHCVLTVFLTRGDNPGGVAQYNQVYGAAITPASYAQGREDGIKAAYAKMAGQRNVWNAGSITTSAGKKLATFTLRDNPRVVLTFMRLPENASKAADPSLASMDDIFFGFASSITSSDGNTFSRDELVGALSDLLKLSEPKFLHIQDSDPDPFIRDGQGNIIGNHTDHIVGARLVLEARAKTPNIPPHSLIRYRDYDINATPENLSESDIYNKSLAFGAYTQFDPLICPPNTVCTDPATFTSWMPADYRGWLRRQYFNIADDQPGSVVLDGRGQLDVFMTGDRSSTIRTVGQTGGVWGSWQDLGGNFSSRPVVGTYRDGRMTVFTRSNSGALLYRTQKSYDGNSWTGWRSLGGDGVSNPVLVKNNLGTLQIFVVSGGGQVYTSFDWTGYGDWSAFTPLSSIFSGFKVWSDPDVATTSKGRTTIFVRDDRGNVRYMTQYLMGLWSGWNSLGQGFQSTPVAEAAADGHIDLFMRGNDNGLYTRQQSSGSRDTWTEWRKLEFGALQFTGQPMVTTGKDGRTEVFVRDMDNSIVRFTRPSPTSAWNPAERLPTDVRALSILGTTFDKEGKVHVVVRSPDGNVYETSTATASGGWSAWTNLGN